MSATRIGEPQQCRYCRAIIRLIPYHSDTSSPLQWGAFIDAPPIPLVEPLYTFQTGEAYVANPGIPRSIAGPFREGLHELPLLIPHRCANKEKAEAKRRLR